jgi:4-hydroxymandelate oxidase
LRRARPNTSPLNPAVTWKTIERIVARSSLPVLVKGVLRPDDARAAVTHGAAGVIVSNHGARQLDGVVPTAVVLEKIAAVADPIPVLVDGGIRTGRDVLRALCLGARAVLIGRPYLWALAISGAAGVTELLLRLRLELENALALTGCTSPADAARDLVVRWNAND